MDYLTNKAITPDILREIKSEVALMNDEFSLQSKGHLKEDIFELLEKIGTLIFFPFEEEDLCGIYLLKNDKHYFIINTSTELEMQIFAAAHELAHSLDFAKVKFEKVTPNLMTEYINHEEFGQEIKKADAIANRFAAEILVGKHQLIEKFNELPVRYNFLTKAVLLSDIFLVPYKTIVKRLIETEILTDETEIKELLNVDENLIKVISERLECRRRNIEISKEKKLGGYIDKAIILYEEDLSTYNELKERMELLDHTPDDFNIINENFDINEIFDYAALNPELEEDYDEEE